MPDDRTTGELGRLIDLLTAAVNEMRDELHQLPTRLDATYQRKDVTELRFGGIERDVSEMRAQHVAREETASTTRRLVYLALFTALVCPVVIAVVVSAMGLHR